MLLCAFSAHSVSDCGNVQYRFSLFTLKHVYKRDIDGQAQTVKTELMSLDLTDYDEALCRNMKKTKQKTPSRQLNSPLNTFETFFHA